jgi:epoxyqueuosine reductase QueG
MNKQAITEIIFQAGCDAMGVAGIESFKKAPLGYHPKNILPEAKSVVVFGKQFPKGTFKAKSNAPYTMVRNQLIQLIDNLSLNLSLQMEEIGYLSVPIPSSEPYEYWDKTRRHGRGIISLKHSAQLAGLGSIGKNTLLVNKEFGNRLWLGGIITTAEIEPDEISKNLCPDSCNICIENCPQQALDGITIDQKKCREICFSCTEGGGWLIACNICRTQCPFAKV